MSLNNPYNYMGDFMKRALFIFFSVFLLISILVLQEIKMASSSQLVEDNYPVIIIDAGHGGEDGGAVGADGTNEKDINLSISLKLNDILTVLGYETRMVRTADISIHNPDADTTRERKSTDIRNRAAIMEEYENCLYVSIHQNKYEDSRIWGAQTFYSPNDEESKNLAQFIQTSIATKIQPDNKRLIKESGTSIYVLYNATKPAVMVECGFISNPNELSQLQTGDYQSQMAFSITSGIINYNISEVTNGTEV